jgi:hypothetical protein
VNKFAVLAASLVASFALAFAVYSAESNPNKSAFPRVVASVRLTNLTTPISITRILNAPRTGLYRVSSYTAMTTTGNPVSGWTLYLGWTDEAGTETSTLGLLEADQIPPTDYGLFQGGVGYLPPPVPIEAIAGTPITYVVAGPTDGSGGTYELFISVEQLQLSLP